MAHFEVSSQYVPGGRPVPRRDLKPGPPEESGVIATVFGVQKPSEKQ